MESTLWLEYLLRFAHLVAGIAWIGSSFYFIWLDSSFTPPESPRRNVDGELFMVHGGFYYQVEKRKFYPGELPKTLHWFKWEATLTWVTGFLLFIVLYWLRGASLLIDPQVRPLTQSQAILLSLFIMIASWLIYDLLWNSKIFPVKAVSSVLTLVFFSGLIYGLTQIFSGRAAFIMTGVVFGTLMLLNVWVRILPGQAKMLKDAQEGKVPDYSLSLKSKARSVHNTYFIFPVLFIMLSNHYPILYNHQWNWLLLILLAVSGALTRHAMVTTKPAERWALLPAAMGFVVLLSLSAPASAPPPQPGAPLEFSRVQGIFQARCVSCHSSRPTDDLYKVAPDGVILENEQQILSKADQIQLQVVSAKTMPLGNKTQMTEEERALIGQWLKARQNRKL